MEAVATLSQTNSYKRYDPINTVKRLIKDSISTSTSNTVIRLKQLKNLFLSGKMLSKFKKIISRVYYNVVMKIQTYFKY